MFKRLSVVLFVLACLVFVLTFSVEAQSGNGCSLQIQFCGLCGDPPIPGADCFVEITYISICIVPSAACAPAAAPDEACTDCNTARSGQTATAVASSPVNLATGNTYIRETDLKIPGLGGGLTLVRTWNSKWPSTQTAFQIGMFGQNWRSTYEERVFLGSDNYMKYSRSDGSFWSFGYAGPLWVLAAPSTGSPTGTSFIGMVQTPTTWTIMLSSGEQRVFNNASGSLTAIIDRNGNTTQLTYDALNRLVTVTDPASRHLTFTYQNSSSRLVTGVSSDVGVSVSYAYDAQSRLSQVTNQDLSTVTFTYNAQSQITSVTDSNGKVLESHTYDSGARGLTSSRALGVEAVTLSYPNP
jgi:YD repeat-containing protein